MDAHEGLVVFFLSRGTGTGGMPYELRMNRNEKGKGRFCFGALTTVSALLRKMQIRETSEMFY
jgi:hypothetical protein